MTHKHYWDDPYCAALDTEVVAVSGAEVIVASSILYPFAGGQERDHGTIGGHEVHAVRREGRALVYTLPEGHGLRAGDRVGLWIDWGRRYALMRLHFAAELVLEVSYRAVAAIEKIGAHIAPDKARIDFLWPEPITPWLPAIQRQAQELIDADLPIVSAFSDPEGERRTWEIAGFARVACGGTHIRRTGEVGALSLRRKNVGKGKERIEIVVGATP